MQEKECKFPRIIREYLDLNLNSIDEVRLGKPAKGVVVWISKKDGRGVIMDGSDPTKAHGFYFEDDLVNPRADFSKLKRRTKVKFIPQKHSGTLIAKNIQVI